jgi:hypothetical protein
MTVRALAGWMLVQPLNVKTANDQLRLGRVHAIGELYDEEMAERIPFSVGDRICWIETPASNVHVLNETLLLVPLNAPMAYEPREDLASDNNGHREDSDG